MFLRTCLTSLSLCGALLLASCSSRKTPSYNPDIGPFDEDGNYVEEWADNPPKRRFFRRKDSSSNTKSTSKSKPEPKVKPKAKPKPKPEPRSKPLPVYRQPEAKPVYQPKPKPKAQPKPTPKAKPKPKPVLVKPKVIRHTVKKGDTLYGLARRYGTSVSEIKRANRLSGDSIRLGSTLVIPKK